MTENEKLIIETIREDRKAYRDTVLPLKLSHIAMNNIIAKEAWEEECSRLQTENAALRERLGKIDSYIKVFIEAADARLAELKGGKE